MRAALFYGKEDLRIEEVPDVKCKDGYVKIKPAYVGICGTDLHEYLGGPTFAPRKGHPHGITGDEIPICLGHEFSGVITELGKGATQGASGTLAVGQHVVVQPTLACQDKQPLGQAKLCGACQIKAENCCDNAGFVGLSGGGGGLSTAVLLPPNRVFPIGDHIPLDVGALVEPLSVAWHAVTASSATAGQTAFVLGGGPIGLAVLQVLIARGIKTVYVAEVAASRQEFARRFGATEVLDPSTSKDLVADVRSRCNDGAGPDVVFDCAGVPASLKSACHAVRSKGTVVNVAIWEKEVPFSPNWLVFREAKYVGVLGYLKEDYEAVVAALGEGKLKPEAMITSKIKLDDLVEGGFKALIHQKEKHVKILVDMTAE